MVVGWLVGRLLDSDRFPDELPSHEEANYRAAARASAQVQPPISPRGRATERPCLPPGRPRPVPSRPYRCAGVAPTQDGAELPSRDDDGWNQGRGRDRSGKDPKNGKGKPKTPNGGEKAVEKNTRVKTKSDCRGKNTRGEEQEKARPRNALCPPRRPRTYRADSVQQSGPPRGTGHPHHGRPSRGGGGHQLKLEGRFRGRRRSPSGGWKNRCRIKRGRRREKIEMPVPSRRR